MNVFRSAITGSDGTVDPGYLGMAVVIVLVLGTIPSAIAMLLIRMWLVKDHPLDLVGLAAVIGAAGTAFGVAAGGVGMFRRGDRDEFRERRFEQPPMQVGPTGHTDC